MSRIFSKCLIVLSVFLTACAGNKPVPVDPQAQLVIEKQKVAERAKQEQILADFQLAVGKLSAGEVGEAKSILLSITENSDKYSGPYVNLGVIEEKENNLEKAEEFYQKALSINPGNLVAYNQLGLLKRKQGDFEQARNLFKKGLDIDANNPDLNYNAGVLFELYLQDYAQARLHYKKYLEAASTPDDDVRKWLVALDRK